MEIQTIDAKAKLLVEENRIMLIDLSLREQEQRVWFEKKQPHHPQTRFLIVHISYSLSISYETSVLLHFV
jgi:hypothetical protein